MYTNIRRQVVVCATPPHCSLWTTVSAAKHFSQNCGQIDLLEPSARSSLVCTSHGVQELGDLVDTLPVSGWRKLGRKTKFIHSRQSGCRERSFGWVLCHLFCLVWLHFLSRHLLWVALTLPHLSSCWAQIHTIDCQWVFYCTCHILVIFFSSWTICGHAENSPAGILH